MNVRSALSCLFLAGGVLFFLLAAINVSGSTNDTSLEKITSAPNAVVDLQPLTAPPLVTNSTPDFKRTDVLSLAILPPNYSCGNCAKRVSSFMNEFEKHSAFNGLSTEAARLIVESNRRTATHFARVFQLSTPVFHSPTVPTGFAQEKSVVCSVGLIHPQTKTIFFEVDLTRGRVTQENYAVFETAREAYRQHTLQHARR